MRREIIYTVQDAEPLCLKAMEIFKDHPDNTMYATKIPFVFVAKVGVFNIGIRYARFGNQPYRWGYHVESGSGKSDHGFDTIQEAYDKAVSVAEEWQAELDADFEKAERKIFDPKPCK